MQVDQANLGRGDRVVLKVALACKKYLGNNWIVDVPWLYIRLLQAKKYVKNWRFLMAYHGILTGLSKRDLYNWNAELYQPEFLLNLSFIQAWA